jgi:phosphotransacetylase
LQEEEAEQLMAPEDYYTEEERLRKEREEEAAAQVTPAAAAAACMIQTGAADRQPLMIMFGSNPQTSNSTAGCRQWLLNHMLPVAVLCNG